MKFIPDSWPPPSINALAVFFLGSSLLCSIALNADDKIPLSIASGLFGWLTSAAVNKQ